MTQQETDELRYLVAWYHMQTIRKAFAEKKAATCQAKHPFATNNQARQAISLRLARFAHTYLCSICGQWHVGGMRAARDRRIGYEKDRRDGK